MKCTGKKKGFKFIFDAVDRIREIRKTDTEQKPIRAYLCECGKYHLTKISSLDIDNIKNKINLRTKKRELRFIEIETEYWIKKFKL